jgi:hypothetical protein
MLLLGLRVNVLLIHLRPDLGTSRLPKGVLRPINHC